MATKKDTAKKGKAQEAKKSGVILAPRITEKASFISAINAYSFDVHVDSTKTHIAQEIKATYKVTPVRVNIVSLRPQKTFVRGKRGTTSHKKKAIVFLKKGDTIKLA